MFKTFGGYRKIAITTKIYQPETAAFYICLGLAGEASELLEKVVRYESLSNGIVLLDEKKKTDLAKELGDVNWYVAALCDEYKIDIDEELSHPVFFVVSSLQKTIQLINMRCGMVCERVKKIIRDRNGIANNDDKARIKEQLEQIVILSKICSAQVGMYYTEVLEMNVEKLAMRKAENKLEGEGDER